VWFIYKPEREIFRPGDFVETKKIISFQRRLLVVCTFIAADFINARQGFLYKIKSCWIPDSK